MSDVLQPNVSLHINQLPDLCLLTIFGQLPTKSLLIVGGVCQRWTFIRDTEAATRKSMTLLIGFDALDYLVYKSPLVIPYQENLLADNGKDLLFPAPNRWS